MNEGKPAKAKWWNRPRPQEPSARAEGTDPAPDETSEPAAPGATGGPVVGDDTDGDFELARPAVRAQSDGASAEGDTGGDFELRRPGAGGSGGRAGASDEGDFELARPGVVPAAVPSAGDVDVAVGSGDDAGAVVVEAAEADGALAVPAEAAVDAAPVPPAPAADAAPTPAAPAVERPKPLHDPDPYSTPPYGEPGPWAPAPPVQHPATTPAHGTAVPMPPPPAHGMPAPAPGLPAPTPGAPASVHGTPMPSAATAPPADASTPAPPPALGTPVPPPTPGTPVPASPLAAAVQQAPPGIPAQPTPSTADTLAQSTPTYAEAPPPTNPWQNYDPWAATPRPTAHPTAPLQQNGAAVVTEQQRRRRAKKVLIVGALLIALVSGGVGGVAGAYLERNGGVGEVELPQAGTEPTGRAPDSVAGIAARALPSVVTLHVSGSEEQGTGTGFVLDDRGHILTNNHVVVPAGDDGEISVTFHSGDTAKATVVGRDSGYDLAVVKVTGVSGLEPLPLGNSDNVQVGDPVIAIGAPFDLEGTVTSGIISAKERPITAGGESGDGSDVSYVDALQTDAPINPGNSGGPLLDARARVIGINSAIRSADSGSDLDSGQSGSIGLGFAIPVNQAKRVAEELINTGKATHPVIGVTLDMDYSGDGARVGTKGSDGGPAVTQGGPGDKAGIKPGDVIKEVDGQRVHSGEELIVKTRAHRPGDRLALTLERGGKEVTLSLTLGSSSGG
ncbi:trypsin-like peptidase domain-containing protein [Streptomyces sp. NPDC049627]|uniref:trypsin-like peptidase domain-containing protein n=1 Tax=Streptomyces sp. NPDC049627 TaxID=3365595 RepID=UPI00379CDF9C